MDIVKKVKDVFKKKDGAPKTEKDKRLEALMKEKESEISDGLARLFGRDYKESLDKTTKYEADELSSMMANQIKDLADSGYTEEMLDEALAVTDGQRKITWQRALSDDHHARVYNNAKIDMKSQINKLKKKIDLYGATNIHKIYNQRRCILDKSQ